MLVHIYDAAAERVGRKRVRDSLFAALAPSTAMREECNDMLFESPNSIASSSVRRRCSCAKSGLRVTNDSKIKAMLCIRIGVSFPHPGLIMEMKTFSIDGVTVLRLSIPMPAVSIDRLI